MIRFKKVKAVFLGGCLFVICLSTGCADLNNSSQNSVGGILTESFDVKAKESIPNISYISYDTSGTSGMKTKVSNPGDGQDANTLAKQSSSGGVTVAANTNTGTGDETEVLVKSKKGQSAVKAAIRGNKELNSTTAKRKAIVSYALQWVGNKYVFGGTSLTNGTDCSGFTMRIMEHFGIKLNRSSTDQRKNGKSVGKPQPGDIVCYYGHVALYIGDGKIVHASNSDPYPRGGIKISSNYRYRRIASIRNVIDQVQVGSLQPSTLQNGQQWSKRVNTLYKAVFLMTGMINIVSQ